MKRFATIGTNMITELFLKAVEEVDGLLPAGIYSRDKSRAEEFAKKYGVKNIYTDLLELAEDENIDAVYIASPNCCHCGQSIQMLENRKHILCEKPIASNLYETKKMFQAAADYKKVLLEGMRPVFDPGFSLIQNNLHKLGKIRLVRFHFYKYSSRYDKFKAGIVENAFRPELSNGALMDIGVYAVHPLIRLFGMPNNIYADSVFLEGGIDGAGSLLLSYKEMQAVISYSKITNGYTFNEIQGEDASMKIDRIEDTKYIEIIYKDGKKEEIEVMKKENNMVYEALTWLGMMEEEEGWKKAIEWGKHSIAAMEVMDKSRKLSGIVFPADSRADSDL